MPESSTEATGMLGGTGLSKSEQHRLLAEEQRRLTLDILRGKTGPMDVNELAAVVATREASGNDVNEEAVKRVAIALHHTHLPKLASAGIIDYDPRTLTVWW